MIWLVGSKGMLGSEVGALLRDRGYSFMATDAEVDITQAAVVRSYAASHGFRWIINCAAYTAVDKAEEEEELAYAINRDGPAHLAVAAGESGAALIHISTDYVFNGEADRPYREEDPVSPLGVYGRSKEAGERAVREICPRHYIIRTAWLYGKNGPNFVSTMLRLFREKDSIGVVDDQTGSPTWAVDLAECIAAVLEVESGNTSAGRYGTYHYTGAGTATWYDFAREIYTIAAETGIVEGPCTINPLTTEAYPTKAKRPKYSVLDTGKIQRVFGPNIPHWRDSLRAFLRSLKET